MNIATTNGVISDANGDVLFYTNGIYVANANDQQMLNGSGLNPSQYTSNHTQHGLLIPQANLIIPFPDDTTKYYLFHTTSDDQFNTYAAYFLYYSVIDMSLDSGLGAVVQKNSVLLNDTLVDGRLIGCKHANGRDWWLTSLEYMTGMAIQFLITPQGILGPYKQDLITLRDARIGQGVFSQAGDKFAYYETKEDLDIYDFDRCTGIFSNRIHIDINDSSNAAGAAFSPSGRFLYVSSSTYMYQFDMWAADVELSKTTIAVWDSFYSPWQPFATTYYLSQLAPDGKIYVSCGNSTRAMHVINYPDSLGTACDFCQHCISLRGYNAFTVPNHPNYFLGADSTSVCDTLHIGISSIENEEETVNLFPNPVENLFYLSFKASDKPKNILLYNSVGEIMNINFSFLKDEYLQIDSKELSSGMYYIKLYFQNRTVTKRFVKI